MDRSGYVRFRRWRFYAEPGQARQTALVWLPEETLTVRYGEKPLAYYTVHADRRGQLSTVTDGRLVTTQYESVRPRLWAWRPNSPEWLLALPVPARRRRRRRQQRLGVQGVFSDGAATTYLTANMR